MMEKFKKGLSIYLILALLLVYVLPIGFVFAEDEITPAPTETPIETQIDNLSTSDTNSTTVSDTGNNSVGVIPTPTESPTPIQEETTETEDLTGTITPTPDPPIAPEADIVIDSSGEVVNDVNSDANTGENISTPSITPTEEKVCSVGQSQNNFSENSPSDESKNSINTGDAASTTNIENTINTVSVNSDTIYQTINIILNNDADIELSDPITIAASILSQKPDDSVITVAATSVSNFAFVSNDIVSSANTGNNLINTQDGGAVDTGDAYSIVSLLNKVNVVVINSRVHVVNINIYGDLNGNIVLPDINSSINCQTCGISLNSESNAMVVNNIDSSANTGENTTTGGSITTGEANSQVDTLNIVNTNVIGANVQALYINTFGEWAGDFIGWSGINPQEGGASLALINIAPTSGEENCSTCTGDIFLKNSAIVLNNISSSANTGANTVMGDNANIKTGNAYSLVSVINFVNSNFINSYGFIGFINIFGKLKGNIGGKAEFAKLNAKNDPQEEQLNMDTDNNYANSSGPDFRQDGGKLEVTTSNNVGEYILPGDTVTFFINVKNTGSGKVYETKLNLLLIKDGENVGGSIYDLGVIEPGKTVKVTTGLVLSEKTPGRDYIARAYAEGLVGQENNLVSAVADSYFKVFGAGKEILAGTNTLKSKTGEVLGSKYPKDNAVKSNSAAELYLLFDVILAYILFKTIRARRKIAPFLARGISAKSRLNALRLFLC